MITSGMLALIGALLAPQDTVSLSIRVSRDSAGTQPIESAVVRSGSAGALTDARGVAALRLPSGPHRVITSRIGFRSDTLDIDLGRDTLVAIVLVADGPAPDAPGPRPPTTIDGVVVNATRGERRVEDTPLRVEVIDEEEIAEKVAMTPGDIAMMLAETGGLRVQPTNPSLGGASVRIHGLRGRYSLLLSDGLPLYGQAGGLGLLQIPPVDLAAVEIIKGSASALHGSSALGGVINLIARRNGDEAEHTALLNQTTRGGTDAVYFGTAPLSSRWGATLLTGLHRQRRNDLDGDRWTDMPGYERVVVRPRFYHDDGNGRSSFLTAGFTAEDRRGGTLPGGTVPGGGAYDERLGTRRADVGGLARWLQPGGSILTIRSSAMEQHHEHRFGDTPEDDRHRTMFAEGSLALPRQVRDRSVTYIAGAAVQYDSYRNTQLPGFDFRYTVPAVFAQVDADPSHRVAVSASIRADVHSEYGTSVNPRVSILLRGPDGGLREWTARLSAGTATFAPTPFTEETEATGLTPVVLLGDRRRAEQAQSASLDIGGPLAVPGGTLELNATGFASRVFRPLQALRLAPITGSDADRIGLGNAPLPTNTVGAELLARLIRELGEDGSDGAEPPALRITAGYTYVHSTERDPATLGDPAQPDRRREVPLTPRHSLGVVAALEAEETGRIGLELYYTGRQALEDNPYRETSEPYLLAGVLAERILPWAGNTRAFVNFENITNVRQTRHDPLLRPSRGPGGRWTTDAWTELVGFTVNGGVRITF
jgi:outer membrane receptor for ferrienterochelin and colicins